MYSNKISLFTGLRQGVKNIYYHMIYNPLDSRYVCFNDRYWDIEYNNRLLALFRQLKHLHQSTWYRNMKRNIFYLYLNLKWDYHLVSTILMRDGRMIYSCLVQNNVRVKSCKIRVQIVQNQFTPQRHCIVFLKNKKVKSF